MKIKKKTYQYCSEKIYKNKTKRTLSGEQPALVSPTSNDDSNFTLSVPKKIQHQTAWMIKNQIKTQYMQDPNSNLLPTLNKNTPMLKYLKKCLMGNPCCK